MEITEPSLLSGEELRQTLTSPYQMTTREFLHSRNHIFVLAVCDESSKRVLNDGQIEIDLTFNEALSTQAVKL